MKKIKSLISLVIIAFISGCGGGGGGDDERSINIKYNYNINSNVDKPIGTILAIYGKDNEILVEAGFQNSWNSYCQNDYGGLQVYEKNNDRNLEHYIIGKPASTFKSGYIWKWNDLLYAENKGISRVYSFELGGAFSELNNARDLINLRANVDCGVYMYNGYRYTYWESKSLDVGSVVTACDSKNNCSASVMSPKTWIYAFGGQGGGVVSAANDGRIFIHDQKSNSWCEASFVNEEYNLNPCAITIN